MMVQVPAEMMETRSEYNDLFWVLKEKNYNPYENVL